MSDKDKLKQLLTSFGVEFNEMSYDHHGAIEINDGFDNVISKNEYECVLGVRFEFHWKGGFQKIYIEKEEI